MLKIDLLIKQPLSFPFFEIAFFEYYFLLEHGAVRRTGFGSPRVTFSVTRYISPARPR